jgi:uncharacterized membrane protein
VCFRPIAGLNFGHPFWLLQVIWAIGWSMVAMAVIAHLPPRWVLAVGVTAVALSPFALPPFRPADSTASIIQNLLFGSAPVAEAPIFIDYAIVPWLGVMAIGFGIGPLFALDAAGRRRRPLALALSLVALFFLLRGLNGYGTPQPWRAYSEPARTAMSFLDVFKYPPSPDFLAITLGLSLIFLGLERVRGQLGRVLGDFGRTPLFTYVAHLYIAHGLMLAAAIAVGRPDAALNLFEQVYSGHPPLNWGWSLDMVYLVWLLVLAMLGPLSRWFAAVKRRRRDWWLSYL